MNITRIEIRNLYGYLNKDIDLDNNISLLVGINGSGKTSVLNVVNWIMTPSLQNLCITEFDKIKIEFKFNKNDYKITCNQSDKELTIDITNVSENRIYPQIQADFKISPKKLNVNDLDLIEKLKYEYSNLGPEKHEEESWDFLFNKLPNPIVIGLDRTLFTEEGNEIVYLENNRKVVKKRTISSEFKNPLTEVLRLSGYEYMMHKNRILELNKKLNDKIMLSSFDETLTIESLNELIKSPKITVKQVESLEVKVKDYFSENIIKNERPFSKRREQNTGFDKIDSYFSNLKKLLQNKDTNDKERLDILYITNLNQFKKLKDLIKEFEDFETKTKKSFEPLMLYLDTINLFLEDSSKCLYFERNTGKLKFKILDKNKEIVKDGKEIVHLSSGEKQILILFTYIKFNNKCGRIFIIDEPELSLHPKWQDNFLTGIKKIMADNTQLLFATHSPSIVGKNKNYCKVLLPY